MRGTGIGLPVRFERRAGIVDIDAVERGREAVGIAFAPLLAVGDDVEPGALLVADREQRGVVLRALRDARGRRATDPCMRTRGTCLDRLVAVDQPVRLRIGADETWSAEALIDSLFIDAVTKKTAPRGPRGAGMSSMRAYGRAFSNG